MCIVVDANVANEFVSGSADSKPILDRIVSKKLKLVCGGKLKTEWKRTRLRRLYQQLILAGSIVEFSDAETAAAVEQIRHSDMRSDDPHVIGLARISGARILFSKDLRLHDDFKNLQLLPSPKGKVYQRAEHVHLLKEGICTCA